MATSAKTVSIADTIIDCGTFTMDRNGKFVRCTEHPALKRGTIVHGYGYAMEHTRWAVTGEGDEIVKLSENYEGSYFSNPFHNLDKFAKSISEKFGIGFYYDLEATPATDEEIEAAIERGRAFLSEQEKKKEAEAEAWRQGVEEVRAKYAGMFEEPTENGTCWDAAHVAKNIRKDLSRSFPGQKFSVRKDGYSSIVVTWTDGPTEEEVDAVIGKHQHSSERDPYNDDLWDTKATTFTTVFGGVEYLRTRREFSEGRQNTLAAELEAICPDLAGQGFHGDLFAHEGGQKVYSDYLRGRDIRTYDWMDSRSLARQILSRDSFYSAPEKKESPRQTDAPAGVTIVDYSEKAIAVTGDTRAISDKLKALGGRFNPRLSCGAGWIFSKKKEAEVRAALA